MKNPSPTLKAAELASTLGVMALGAGFALLFPDELRRHALVLLAVGLVVHAVGMGLKYRLEHRMGPPLWWERLLFWLCWASLAGLAAWITVRTAAG